MSAERDLENLKAKRLRVDPSNLRDTLSEIPDSWNRILREFDEEIEVSRVIAKAPSEEKATLETVRDLLDRGVLVSATGELAHKEKLVHPEELGDSRISQVGLETLSPDVAKRHKNRLRRSKLRRSFAYKEGPEATENAREKGKTTSRNTDPGVGPSDTINPRKDETSATANEGDSPEREEVVKKNKPEQSVVGKMAKKKSKRKKRKSKGKNVSKKQVATEERAETDPSKGTSEEAVAAESSSARKDLQPSRDVSHEEDKRQNLEKHPSQAQAATSANTETHVTAEKDTRSSKADKLEDKELDEDASFFRKTSPGELAREYERVESIPPELPDHLRHDNDRTRKTAIVTLVVAALVISSVFVFTRVSSVEPEEVGQAISVRDIAAGKEYAQQAEIETRADEAKTPEPAREKNPSEESTKETLSAQSPTSNPETEGREVSQPSATENEENLLPVEGYSDLISKAERSRGSKARKLYKEALALNPKGSEALIWLAFDALNRGKIKDAKNFSALATELDPTSSKAWITLGSAFEELGNKKEANRAYNECVKQASGKWLRDCRRMAR